MRPTSGKSFRPRQKPPSLASQVRYKAESRLRAKAEGDRNIVIRGLGLSGMVGWSVTLPALLGLALGMWIDRRFPNSYSWTLMFLILGIVLGCWNAWRWMQQQQDEP
ncbi:AtpZ/AtpI family protein [Synechococcus sp. CS-602]|uniref:AtpZ/AtpI family protein n=1 Tax=Synechococcaceae TaxID=1890426 RepID=UPI0008FF2EB3|nr:MULTISPECIES: AtpZ/AtpI family protein [Synechococcaceae]MCT4363303.1 AtpZ/AtpI family protein [Candidatus Regnicoccus frigidus MAG-AL1]MCT0202007.1 AtpZ/AtpI family protein [Synechococcus sp. CS-603]MCT0205029.1 AtpZ/AtpI family protein [Synechococcus sp. CS-602]MCT0246233.1 AtpZ/AtpI family protein [Synechococcus sp. CS-601]MCT4367509.1 AtpZ/AtpI family protein [Candidatus Regnicoccus frigidus MAG-AL2]